MVESWLVGKFLYYTVKRKMQVVYKSFLFSFLSYIIYPQKNNKSCSH